MAEQGKKELKIKLVIVGENGVGKSSLVQKFMTYNFDPNIETTMRLVTTTKQLEVNTQRIELTIWDTNAGQEKYRSLGPLYYGGSEIGIVVYDITRKVVLYNVIFILFLAYSKDRSHLKLFHIG